jgi:hypothetical protein
VTGLERTAVGVGVGRPRPDRHRTATRAALRQGRDHDRQSGELLSRRFPADDAEKGAVLTHSGMFPCFLGGSVSRLFASTRSALVTCTRVCDGGITMSTYPRSAAM